MTSAPVRWFKGFLVVFSLFTTTLFFGALILSLVPIKFILKKTAWDQNIKNGLNEFQTFGEGSFGLIVMN